MLRGIYRMEAIDTTTKLPLASEHKKMLLEESAIDPGIVEERGYFSASQSKMVALGFARWQANGRALIIPMYDTSGVRRLYQARHDESRERKNGSPARYETPHGEKIILDVHPRMVHLLADPTVRLWVVEGVKKADAVASLGEVVIALTGVDCWRRDGAPLPDWDLVSLLNREVLIAFDADIIENNNVLRALDDLIGFLGDEGARAYVVQLHELGAR
jgi:hypothetical protein